MQEMQVYSLGQEDPLEKEMATHSSFLAWEMLWTEEPGGLQSMGSQRVRHDWELSTTEVVLRLTNNPFKFKNSCFLCISFCIVSIAMLLRSLSFFSIESNLLSILSIVLFIPRSSTWIIFLKNDLFVYFLVFDCTGLSLDVSFLWLRGAGATLCFGVVASLVVAHRLERAGSGVVMHSLVALQHMGASCIGIKPMSAALAGRFLTTRPLWKPPYLNLFDMF